MTLWRSTFQYSALINNRIHLYTIKRYSRADVFVLKLKILSKSLKQSVTRTIYNKIQSLQIFTFQYQNHWNSQKIKLFTIKFKARNYFLRKPTFQCPFKRVKTLYFPALCDSPESATMLVLCRSWTCKVALSWEKLYISNVSFRRKL